MQFWCCKYIILTNWRQKAMFYKASGLSRWSIVTLRVNTSCRCQLENHRVDAVTVIKTIAVFTHIYFDMEYPRGKIIDFYVYLPYIPSVILLRFIGLLILPHSAFRLFIFFGTYNRSNLIVGAVNTYFKINI